MNFNEYKSAEYWTKKFLSEQEEPKAPCEHGEQMTLLQFIGILIAGCAFFGLLWVACALDPVIY